MNSRDEIKFGISSCMLSLEMFSLGVKYSRRENVFTMPNQTRKKLILLQTLKVRWVSWVRGNRVGSIFLCIVNTSDVSRNCCKKAYALMCILAVIMVRDSRTRSNIKRWEHEGMGTACDRPPSLFYCLILQETKIRNFCKHEASVILLSLSSLKSRKKVFTFSKIKIYYTPSN